MSNEVQGLVWRARFPTPIAKLIALKLADNSNDDGGSIFPSINTIERQTGIAHSTVCDWLRVFDECGLVKRLDATNEKPVGGAYANTRHREFNLELLRAIADTRRLDGSGHAPTDEFREVRGEKLRRQSWRIVPIEVNSKGPTAGPVRESDRSGDRTEDVRETNSWGPGAGHKPSSNRQGPSHPPPSPREAGACAGDGFVGSGQGKTSRRHRPRERDLEAMLADLRMPGRERVVDLLLAPLARARRIRAPVVSAALATIADSPATQAIDDDGLAAALKALKLARGEVVRPSDIEAAIEAAAAGADERRRLAAAAVANAAADPEAARIWRLAIDWLRGALGADIVRTMLEPLAVIGFDGEKLRLGAATRFTAAHVRERWGHYVETSVGQAAGRMLMVEIVVAPIPAAPCVQASRVAAPGAVNGSEVHQ